MQLHRAVVGSNALAIAQANARSVGGREPDAERADKGPVGAGARIFGGGSELALRVGGRPVGADGGQVGLGVDQAIEIDRDVVEAELKVSWSRVSRDLDRRQTGALVGAGELARILTLSQALEDYPRSPGRR